MKCILSLKFLVKTDQFSPIIDHTKEYIKNNSINANDRKKDPSIVRKYYEGRIFTMKGFNEFLNPDVHKPVKLVLIYQNDSIQFNSIQI